MHFVLELVPRVLLTTRHVQLCTLYLSLCLPLRYLGGACAEVVLCFSPIEISISEIFLDNHQPPKSKNTCNRTNAKVDWGIYCYEEMAVNSFHHED